MTRQYKKRTSPKQTIFISTVISILCIRLKIIRSKKIILYNYYSRNKKSYFYAMTYPDKPSTMKLSKIWICHRYEKQRIWKLNQT